MREKASSTGCHKAVRAGWLAICATLLTPLHGEAADYKVLHVMSYHAEWEWNRVQFDSFRKQLADLDVEYRVIEMDTYRRKDPEWIEEISAEARRMIDAWEPDLVYTNDDNAQKFVVAAYPEGRTRFVFSAVNAEPETYGFDMRADVTGVLEREHISQTLRLLGEIVPHARRLAVIVDEGATWPGLVARMREAVAQDDTFEVVSYDTVATFAEYKRVVLAHQDDVDALGVLGVFTLEDEAGRPVPFEEVLRWTAENSALPDFSFWESRIELGTLCAVTVSAQAQGDASGKIARELLVRGAAPRDFDMRPTLKGEPVISLARARALGIALSSTTLLNARVVTDYAWR